MRPLYQDFGADLDWLADPGSCGFNFLPAEATPQPTGGHGSHVLPESHARAASGPLDRTRYPGLPIQQHILNLSPLYPVPGHQNEANDPLLPSDSQLSESINVYFERFSPMFPIIQRERLSTALRQGQHRLPNTSFRFLILSMLALVETSGRLEDLSRQDELPPDNNAGPLLLAVRRVKHDGLDLDHITAVINIFVAEDMLSDRKAAWYRLQEAITLAQLLELDRRDTYDGQHRDEEAVQGMKVYFILFICERATVMLQRLPSRLHQSLRLPDHAYQLAQPWMSTLPAHASFQDFPLPHLRLFSLIDSQVLSCWHGSCSAAGRSCNAWTVESAMRLQRDLTNESESALITYRASLGSHAPSVGTNANMQNVNLVVTVAWLRE